MSDNEVRIRIAIDKPGVDDGLKQTNDDLKRVGETATKAGSAAKPAIDSIGVSAKQTAAALRGVPAQFTDIVTALQGGQAPLTVLLQQGGQLKDMFGGIGPAARALGGYVVSLINPVTIAAGSIGVLALAYAKGAEEQENFARTLILTGNAASVSAGQLMDAAREVASATGATQGSVAEVMNVIVASGKVPVDVLNQVTKAAIDLERSGGPAATQTAKEFASLADKPVEAILELNEKYHIFTAAVFENVKALADQGKESEAARAAQVAYADAIEGRVPAMVQNLGYLQRAWMTVGDAAKGAWNWMLNIGAETDEQRLEKAKRYAEYLARSGDSEEAAGKKSNAAAQQAIADLEAKIAGERRLAAAKSETIKADDAKIKQVSDLSKYMADQSNAPKAVKLAADIEKENKAFAAAVAGLDKTDASYIAALKAHNERVATIRSSYARGAKDPAQELLLARYEEEARIHKQADDEYNKIEKQNEKRARAQQIVTNYNNKADQTVERIMRQNELIGVSEREVQVREALYKVEDEAQQVNKEITEQVKDETERKKALAAVEDDLADKKLRVAEATRQAYDESHTFAAGWTEALTQYEDSAKNAAKTAQDAFSGMSSAMEGAIKTFVKTGKVDFESFGDAVINTLIEIQMQSLRTNVLSPLMSDGGSWLSSLFGIGGSSSLDTGAGSGFDSALWGLTASAKGNVFSGSPSLHRYVNTVQSEPTFFSYGRLNTFANGGVFAEAGEEAVMPLQRDANGRLGVSSSGQSAPSIQVNIVESAGSNKNGTVSTSDQGGKTVIDVFVEQIKGAIVQDIGSGGVVASAMESQYALSRSLGAWR